MKKLGLLLLLITTLVSCSREKTQDELYNEVKSGVVLITTKYYYEVIIPNGSPLYFSELDEDGDFKNMTPDKNEMESSPSIMTGTGFFVNNNGKILTNRHVVEPSLTKEEIKNAYSSLISALNELVSYSRQELSNQFDNLEEQKSSCYTTDFYGQLVFDSDKYNEIVSQQDELRETYQNLNNTAQQIQQISNPDNIRINVITKIGVCFNETFATEEYDYLERNSCVLIDKAQDDVDLAVIQLKSKMTPSGHYVFSLNPKETSFFEKITSKDSDGKLKMGQTLYMVGFNAGPILASTKQGINAQMTSGKVTQLPDGQKLLYDIPTVSGSSGSPIIDTKGNLIAVNYAKLRGSDNFNFGIPIEKAKTLNLW